jgi:hypothetical protein
MSFLERLHPLFRTPGAVEPNVAYFVARLGGEGELWAQEYTRPEHVELIAGTDRALRALRARRIEEGRQELRTAEEMFQAAESATAPDVHHMHGRWYYGVLAYYFYCAADYGRAEETLDRAQQGVRQAIELRRFLVPYAMECYELWFQRIRVARSQRLWPEVWRRMETARQIASGEKPCCVLSDGTAVGIPTVQAFYSGFEALTEEERQPLRRILDAEDRSRQLRSLLSEVYFPSGFVIPYTPSPGRST